MGRHWRPWLSVCAVLFAGLVFATDGVARGQPVPFGLRLTPLAELDEPTVMAVRTGDDLLYVGEKSGQVRAVTRDGQVLGDAVLDLSAEVSSGYEQGLVGMAFAPRGDRLYVGITDAEGDSRILEFRFDEGRADQSSRRELLFLEQPHEYHNNGQVLFGPDGMLYLGFGDGGGVYTEGRRSQDLGNLYGKLLRIDPRPDGARAYRIPADNPFVGRPGAREEIWVYGLRQPWRFSFDRLTEDLWIGDVGEGLAEEIDFLPSNAAGVNFGWDALEGSHRRDDAPEPQGHVLPILEYPHSDGRCAVIGGHVYRGLMIPELQGYYVFGDLCSGRLTGLRQVGGKPRDTVDLGVELGRVSSFGEDEAGELYVLSQTDGLFRLEHPRARPADRSRASRQVVRARVLKTEPLNAESRASAPQFLPLTKGNPGVDRGDR